MKLDEHLLEISQIGNNKTDVNKKANTGSAKKKNKTEKSHERELWGMRESK